MLLQRGVAHRTFDRPAVRLASSPFFRLSRSAYNGSSRGWKTLPNTGSLWRSLYSLESPDEPGAASPVKLGQVVRVDYTASLDDGTVVATSTASFRVEPPSGRVLCAAIEEAVPGMRLGDTRRVRSPPSARRGRALWRAPHDEFIDYDVTLTGIVAQMKILTVDRKHLLLQRPAEDLPLWRRLLDAVVGEDRGTSSLARLAALAGLDANGIRERRRVGGAAAHGARAAARADASLEHIHEAGAAETAGAPVPAGIASWGGTSGRG